MHTDLTEGDTKQDGERWTRESKIHRSREGEFGFEEKAKRRTEKSTKETTKERRKCNVWSVIENRS